MAITQLRWHEVYSTEVHVVSTTRGTPVVLEAFEPGVGWVEVPVEPPLTDEERRGRPKRE